jgi:hypothetical protein
MRAGEAHFAAAFAHVIVVPSLHVQEVAVVAVKPATLAPSLTAAAVILAVSEAVP